MRKNIYFFECKFISFQLSYMSTMSAFFVFCTLWYFSFSDFLQIMIFYLLYLVQRNPIQKWDHNVTFYVCCSYFWLIMIFYLLYYKQFIQITKKMPKSTWLQKSPLGLSEGCAQDSCQMPRSNTYMVYKAYVMSTLSTDVVTRFPFYKK